MVDGEASAEQLIALRPHLRNCAACRAMVRELRGSNAPLAALFPVGALGALGDHDGGALDAAGDLLSRLWHSLWGDLSDRAATAAFRAQSVAQAVLPGKSAAPFASMGPLAGGGVAIDEAGKGGEPPRAALHVPSVSTAADRITRAATVATVSAAPAATTPTTATEPAARSRTRTRRARKRRPRVHRKHVVAHVSRHPAATVAAPRRAAPTTTRAAAATPAVTTPTQTRPAPPPPAPAVAAPARRAPAATSSGTGSGEFGLESH